MNKNTIRYPILTMCILCIILSNSFGKTSLTLQQVSDSIQTIMKNDHIPGMIVGITTRDSTILSRGYGFADIEHRRIVDNKTRFRMGSITKMFVSIGIVKLVQQGRLKLDDKIEDIAPEIQFKNQWEKEHPLRLVNLLEHTSGFDDVKLNRMYSLDTSTKSALEIMKIQSPSMVCRWAPGERFSYSNPNYAILGYLIEKISKQTYEKYLTENILSPLNMTSSSFSCFSNMPEQSTSEYISRNGKIIKVPSVTLMCGAAGSLWSCSDDMLSFLRMLLKSGDPILSEKSFAVMETVHSTLASKVGLKNGYALGNFNSHYSNKYLFRGHDGFIGTSYSTCIYNKALGVGLIISSNGNNDNSKIEELITAYIEQDLDKPPIIAEQLNLEAIKPYLGYYQSANPRFMIGALRDWFLGANRIYLKNDSLYMQFLFDLKPTKLIQTKAFTFAGTGDNSPWLTFTTTNTGQKLQLWVGSYFEKKSLLYGALSRFLLIAMVMIVISSAIVAIVSLLRSFFQKRYRFIMLLKLLPAIAIGLFSISIFKLIETETNAYLLFQLNSISFRSLIIYLGTFFVGIVGIYCLGLFLLTITKKNKRFKDYYWLAVYFSFCSIAVILLSNGLIGLKTWAM